MALQEWALPQLSQLLPLDNGELSQILTYTNELPDAEASKHFENLLGDSPPAANFIQSYISFRAGFSDSPPQPTNGKMDSAAPPAYAGMSPPDAKMSTDPNDFKQAQNSAVGGDAMFRAGGGSSAPQSSSDSKNAADFAPPSYPPPTTSYAPPGTAPPSSSYAPPSHAPPTARAHNHSNQVIEAAKVRARDEQDMQNALQNLQFQYRIYNAEIEPEHDADYPCSCAIHIYQRRKWARYGLQEMWSRAVMYPGEKSYNDNPNSNTVFSSNPYRLRVTSPYGYRGSFFGPSTPSPKWHATNIHQTIDLNNSLNKQAQAKIDAAEPSVSIWEENTIEAQMSKMNISDEKRKSLAPVPSSTPTEKPKAGKFSSFRKSIGIKSSDERVVAKATKAVGKGSDLRNSILAEEQGRWPDEQWRELVMNYQAKVGMTNKIAHLRVHQPIQYLHLLRAGYFEPIPVAWANQASNPLKFSIESASGWRGITPAWRGYEDTAEERLYWVLNHREGSVGMRMKPDFISEINMARARMASAVEPPPQYFSPNDTCHLQHTSEGYSKQVMPAAFHAFDRPELPTDDTMILLDVSGSMDFDPVRPNYDQYLITGYSRSTQPKNKDVAKAIIRRFTDAMAHHDHTFSGYDLVTFSDRASYIGTITHQNLEAEWRKVRLGGGTRVMTGWQKVKDLHFQKHSESATHHPIYGWQAGPQTPMLRLLLLLDGEATDMDEFELDLLGLSWAHVTIFLIGVDGCPHHHRHANELQRISDVNHHVSFVDAQGNTPERFVTHELLKRHLGYDVSMREFEEMEQLPAYTETAGGNMR